MNPLGLFLRTSIPCILRTLLSAFLPAGTPWLRGPRVCTRCQALCEIGVVGCREDCATDAPPQLRMETHDPTLSGSG